MIKWHFILIYFIYSFFPNTTLLSAKLIRIYIKYEANELISVLELFN